MEPKKLTRSYDGVIAGVCGGLGEYFSMDPVLIRVMFLVLFFVGGGGFLLYIILWIIVPRATNYYYMISPEKEENLNSNEAQNMSASSNVNSGKLTSYIIGIAFIIFGLILLLNRFLHIGFMLLWPICLIIAGIVIIIAYSNKRKNSHEKE